MTVELKVTTGYWYSKNHGRFYAGGTKRYGDNPRRTLSMVSLCICGDPLYDGEPICSDEYEQNRIVHINCCTIHDQH